MWAAPSSVYSFQLLSNRVRKASSSHLGASASVGLLSILICGLRRHQTGQGSVSTARDWASANICNRGLLSS
jgi:hypothetical protein